MKRLLEFLINSRSTGVIKDNYFIDLGLSVLWAKCNIGAKKETDYGHYYQWGGLEPMDKKECNWKNAPFNNGNNNFDEDYFNSIKDKVCPNGILASKYDVATQTYGTGYRMPTKAEFDELISGTNNEWITNYNGTGINGYKFTNKSDSTKFIFIPAAGYRWFSSTGGSGSYARMWSASINKGFGNEHTASDIYFGNDGKIYANNSHRDCGFSVRAVKEK